jgi:tRNA (cmo5U34)-methyltransferase
MSQAPDTNAAIWQSSGIVEHWAAEANRHERLHGGQWQFIALLLPFGEQDEFTFCDLGAGTGNLSRAILSRYPRSKAILADFSAQMMGAGESELKQFAGRYQYVEFDMLAGEWPVAIPAALDAVVTSLCVHHLPDDRKRGLFAEIFGRLIPGGWYLNYDPITTDDAVVKVAWERVNDILDPETAHKRQHATPEDLARRENHVRYIIPLDRQLEYLRAAGFEGIDVYFKRLDYVVYGGRKPA